MESFITILREKEESEAMMMVMGVIAMMAVFWRMNKNEMPISRENKIGWVWVRGKE